MTVTDSPSGATTLSIANQKLKKLTIQQVKQIDDALASIGDYGEVHLILQHGELRYVNKVESQKAWRPYDHPG